MHRPGINPLDVRMSDILCDFCHAEWVESRAMVEGHHGSVICGSCLSVAFASVIVADANEAIPGYRCTLCLEERQQSAWRSPAYPEAFVCERCIRLAARQLARDDESGWSAPSQTT